MHTRTARVEEAASDGTFTMTLATEGEASDGDILSIKGGQIPERMPMLLSHWNDPTATAGSITQPRKFLRETPKRLRALGQVELGGEGQLADVRRDVFHMIEQQHVSSVSIRWSDVNGGKAPVRRIDLPKDHHAHVASDEPNQVKRYGRYWPEWRALEGSIVALGADPQALIGRSQATEGAVASFWRAMAEDAEDHDGTADLAAALAALRIQSNECIDLGASTADRINAVAEDTDPSSPWRDEFEPVTLSGRTFFLPTSVADQLRDREEVKAPDPEPVEEVAPDPVSPLAFDASQIREPLDAEAIVQAVAEAIDKHEARLIRNVRSLWDSRTGKVS